MMTIEPTIRFEKTDAPEFYRVFSDCLRGRMEFVGYVERSCGAWLAYKGEAFRPFGIFRTRKLAIEALH